MKCIGCDADIASPVAYAIMAHGDVATIIGHEPTAGEDIVMGDRFVGAPVCGPCFTDPAHRIRTLKAHYTSVMFASSAVLAAGSSNIG